jgi:putative spermidine/putrescine transport system ATP-binding protein
MTAAVEFQNVSRHFGSVRAVDGVDLTIAEGSFFAMLGPSGSGKTTCLRLISGFEKPTAARSASSARMSAKPRRNRAT